MNRDILKVYVSNTTDIDYSKKIKKRFKKEYPNYYVVVIPSLNTHDIKFKVFQLPK